MVPIARSQVLPPSPPGLYPQENASGVRSISGAPTSVALFVGPTVAGIDQRPIRLRSFNDFEQQFGGLSQTSALSYSVLHFFANGGSEARVLRVPAEGARAAASGFRRDDGASNLSVMVTALSSGLASNGIFVEFDPFVPDAQPYTATCTKKLFTLTVSDRLTGQVERFADLSTSSASPRFAPTVVNDPAIGSKLVEIWLTGPAIDAEGPQATGTIYRIATPTTAGTFTDDQNLKLCVEFRDAEGAVDTTASILIDVTVFAGGADQPGTPHEFCTRLTAALNTALRADPRAAAIMPGISLDGAVFEDGSLIRLRVAPVGMSVITDRRADGRVFLSTPAAGTSLLETCGLVEKVSNPSRFQLGQPYAFSQIIGTPVAGTDGPVSGQPASDAFKRAVMALMQPDPFFNILCLPDVVRPSAADPKVAHHSNLMSIYSEAALVCAARFAFLLIDPPPGVVDLHSAEAWKSTGMTFRSDHAAAYFPNIRVDDPLRPGETRNHPPSGAIAGIFARTDSRRGVWKAPAGTEAILSGVYGPSVMLSDSQQGVLNPLGLNVIRTFPVHGTVAFGSRTLEGTDALASEWKYIPVRRTASHILRSLSQGVQWAVHEPNDAALWDALRLHCGAFMQGLFQQGAFRGTSARESYFVVCDASTTTAVDIRQGVVATIIGFAPLKPAEFVVLNLRVIVRPIR
jgi:phage tail sheath protein FI